MLIGRLKAPQKRCLGLFVLMITFYTRWSIPLWKYADLSWYTNTYIFLWKNVNQPTQFYTIVISSRREYSRRTCRNCVSAFPSTLTFSSPIKSSHTVYITQARFCIPYTLIGTKNSEITTAVQMKTLIFVPNIFIASIAPSL